VRRGGSSLRAREERKEGREGRKEACSAYLNKDLSPLLSNDFHFGFSIGIGRGESDGELAFRSWSFRAWNDYKVCCLLV
jgi:hypothetical protein